MSKKLTREEVIQEFRKMWRHLAATGRDKEFYLREVAGEPDHLKNSCYLCEYTVLQDKGQPLSELCRDHCPINWPDGGVCDIDAGLYESWFYALDKDCTETAKLLAGLIAELPEK